MVTAASPNFCAASTTPAPPPRSSSILSRSSATLVRARSVAISFFRLEATLSYDGSTPGSILPILTSATPNRPCTGWLTSPDGSENAALAIAVSIMADFVISPRSTSGGLSPRSLARSSNDNPDAMRLRAAIASSVFGNTICETWRCSGVPSLSRRCSKIFLASSSETSDHLPISSGVIATKDILRYSGARNWVL